MEDQFRTCSNISKKGKGLYSAVIYYSITEKQYYEGGLNE